MVLPLGLFILGCLFGSFLNVVGMRLPAGQSILRPPSSCTTCGKRLKARDLIPLLSWMLNKGKCRMCKANISLLYPTGELAAGLGFAVLPYLIEPSPELYFAYVVFAYLVVITISDMRYRVIPNKLTYPLLMGTLLFRLFYHPLPLWDYAIGFLIGGGLLLLASIIGSWLGKPNAMGGGDIKLMALIGLAGGIQLVIFCLFLSSLIGCIVGLAFIYSGRWKSKEIPFAPFISLGACISAVAHMEVFGWYAGLF